MMGVVSLEKTKAATAKSPELRLLLRDLMRSVRKQLVVVGALLGMVWGSTAVAQTCYEAGDMDAPVKTAIEAAGKRYFDMAARGDSASLKQNAIASLASDFSTVEAAIKDNLSALTGAQATPRSPYLLKVEGTAPQERAEFLCGVFNKSGQTANSAEFVIPNLPPGSYGIVTVDVAASKAPYAVSFVLQLQASDWKVGGFYVKKLQIGGHDAKWFADKARAFQSKGQNHNAWFYFLEARELAVPVSFMYTQVTDKLYDESQSLKPLDLPADGKTVDLAAGAKVFKLTDVFATAVGDDLDLVVKYQAADVSDSARAFQENTAVLQALVAKFPELRGAFDGMVARAVETSGRDYGTLLPMKDIK
jgi:hypothetical protein